MEISENDVLLVTGATGLVGSHIAEAARGRGIRTRAVVRSPEKAGLLKDWGVELVAGDMTDAASLARATEGVTLVVHCAAKVGDWGPIEDYRAVNVDGLRNLLEAVENSRSLKRFVHISSLGVYEARDHHGTDETEPPSLSGIDGYTLTKAESEQLVVQHIEQQKLPAVILRPGFVYGPRDQTVLPRIVERLKSGGFKYLGSGEQLLNNVFVGNVVEAVFLAIACDTCVGEIYNITDDRLVTKKEFIGTIARGAGLPEPTKSVPLPVAKFLARVMEGTARAMGKKEAPLLSGARIKFLGLNLDFCIDKAKRELGYAPRVDFQDGMQMTMDWCRERGVV